MVWVPESMTEKRYNRSACVCVCVCVCVKKERERA